MPNIPVEMSLGLCVSDQTEIRHAMRHRMGKECAG